MLMDFQNSGPIAMKLLWVISTHTQLHTTTDFDSEYLHNRSRYRQTWL